MVFAAPRREDDGIGGMALDAARLAEANINPATGLANDYLNHFNEAIMTLELLTTIPECVEDFLAWQPKTYREHFHSSKLKHRELAIAAYDAAEPMARQQLDLLASAMTAGLLTVRDALQAQPSPDVTALMAQRAVAELKHLASRAGAIINGVPAGEQDAFEENGQAAIDALLDR